MGNRLDHICRMMVEIQETKKARWLTDSDVWIIDCKSHFVSVEMLRDLDLSTNAGVSVGSGVIIEKSRNGFCLRCCAYNGGVLSLWHHP